MSGSGTLSFTTLPLGATGIVSGTLHNLLYVTSNHGLLYVVDPALGKVIDSVRTGLRDSPAPSTDAAKLLARTATGVIRWGDPTRIRSTFADLIPVPTNVTLKAILPVPGSSLSLATVWTNVLNTGTVLIWDSATVRPRPFPVGREPIAFVAPDSLLATTDTGIALLELHNDGLYLVQTPPGFRNTSSIDFAVNGREVITSTGQVLDLNTRRVIDSIPLHPASYLGVHPSRQQLLAIEAQIRTLQAFDFASRQRRGPDLQLPIGPEYPFVVRLNHWGTDGIAYAEGGYLCILRTSLVGP